MPQVFTREDLHEAVETMVARFADDEGIPPEEVAFVLPEVEGARGYGPSKTTPTHRLHPRFSYGQVREETANPVLTMARDGHGGAFLGLAMFHKDELEDEARGAFAELRAAREYGDGPGVFTGP